MRHSIISAVLCKLVDGTGLNFRKAPNSLTSGRGCMAGSPRWADIMLAVQQVGERHNRTLRLKFPRRPDQLVAPALHDLADIPL